MFNSLVFCFPSLPLIFFSTNRKKKQKYITIWGTHCTPFHVDIFCPRHRSKSARLYIRSIKNWFESLTMGQIFDRQFAEPTNHNHNQGKHSSLKNFFILINHFSDKNFWYISITTWISFANSQKSKCYRSMSCGMCLANISSRWNSMARVGQMNECLCKIFVFLFLKVYVNQVGRMHPFINELKMMEFHFVKSIYNLMKEHYDSMLDK